MIAALISFGLFNAAWAQADPSSSSDDSFFSQWFERSARAEAGQPLGGFVIPPIMGFAVHDLGQRGYAIGFIVFVFLAMLGLSVVWVLKYTREAPALAGQLAGAPPSSRR